MDTALNVFNQISLRIIMEQANIIGALAWEEAKKVDGLNVANSATAVPDVTISGEPREVINALVARYEKLFGKLSRDVCREAVVDLTSDIPATDMPTSLK